VTDHPAAIPAATVVLVRDGRDGIETLMLRRGSGISFGGMWVFPGGRVEDADRTPGDDDGGERCARRAAAREAQEECALAVDADDLVAFSHWTPPAIAPKRYATWFFLARAGAGEVLVDGGEIHEHAWLHPAEVLARRNRGEIDLAPPTWVTLHDLAEAGTVDDALALAARRRPVPRYVTRAAAVDGGIVTLWAGDAGYDTTDPGVEGARNRLWMLDDGWRYERT
jgi:8-oxo-dGTP pyrophosphatase MutT (NUDIX family)